MRMFVQALLGLLAFLFFAYFVMTGIGWFAIPAVLLTWATVAVSRRPQEPPLTLK